MKKTLDQKVEKMRSGSQEDVFLLVDAKDPTESVGIESTGLVQGMEAEGRYKTRQQFYEDIRKLVREEVLDVMLTSLQTMDQLTRDENLFEGSPMTPAVRMNQSTDIWLPRGSFYTRHLSRSFSASDPVHVMYGTASPEPDAVPSVDLVLYAMTFNNDLEADLRTLEDYRDFRTEAEKVGLRHFLEVFNPNVQDCGIDREVIPAFVNDQILRVLSGIPAVQQPLFLKIPYNGPRAMEELTQHDSNLIVGILGGSSGTTRDAFQLIYDAKSNGAKAATFGRRIKNSEDPCLFVRVLRAIVDDGLLPEEAVRTYHDGLAEQGIRSLRPLEEDQQVTHPVLKA